MNKSIQCKTASSIEHHPSSTFAYFFVFFFISLIHGCSGGGSGGSGSGQTSTNNPIGLISDIDQTPNSISEDAEISTTVGITASASDPDTSDTITYSLSPSSSGPFQINSSTGVITLSGRLDFEMEPSHTLTVTATSSDGTSSSAQFTVEVIDYPIIDLDFPLDGGVYTRNELSIIGNLEINNMDSVEITAEAGAALFNRSLSATDQQFKFSPVSYATVGGKINVTINATSDSGETSQKKVSLPFSTAATLVNVGTGISPEALTHVAYSPEHNKLYANDLSLRSILEIDIESGNRSLILEKPGSTIKALAYEGSRNRILFYLSGNIEVLNLDDLSESVLSTDGNDGLSFGLNGLMDLELDIPNARLIASVNHDISLGGALIVAINLEDGTRSVISGQGKGSGPAFSGGLEGITIDRSRNSLYVVDSHADTIFKVNLGSGDREILSDNTFPGTPGASYIVPTDVVLDPQLDRLFVSDARNGIIQISLSGPTKGERRQAYLAQTDIVDVTSPYRFALDSKNQRVFSVGFDRGSIGSIEFGVNVVAVIDLNFFDYQVLSFSK